MATTAEPEPVAESGTTAEPEPVAEPGTTAEPEPVAEPGGGASLLEMLAPPLLLVLLLLIGLLILSVLSQPRWWRTLVCRRRSLLVTRVESKPAPQRGLVSLCTPEDRDILDRFSRFQNRPWSLFLVSAPALLSLACCPFTLLLYKPLVSALWPDDLFPEGQPNVNDAIAAFLTPAGLVYAIAFGFAFQEAVGKQTVAAQRYATLLQIMDTIMILAANIRALTLLERQRILIILKNETIKVLKAVIKQKAADVGQTEYGSEDLWSILKIVKRVRESGQTTDVENSFCDQLVQQTFELDSVASDRLGQLGATMKGIQWFFLESLGMFSFFGILLLKADSYRLEITMCMLTVFSISLFCYVLADLDQPYHGVFKVNLGVLVEFIEHTHNEFQSLQEVEAVDMQPPPNLFGNDRKTSLGTMHK